MMRQNAGGQSDAAAEAVRQAPETDRAAEAAVEQAAEPAEDVINGLLSEYLTDLPAWADALITIAVPIVIVLVVHGLVYWLLLRLTRSDRREPARKLVEHTKRPALALALVIGTGIGIQLAAVQGATPAWFTQIWPSVFTVLAVVATTWLVVGFVSGIDDWILVRYKLDSKDNLRARRVHTQVRLLSRIVRIVIVIIGIAVALTVFEGVAAIGASLLASAGIAGIVVGFAARPVLGNIIAGIQIALTQPIRLDDAVVIEGEWGWIEEITTTYVVVKIWDQRRLIVPFSRIIEAPFQNWTRTSAEILGSVILYVDYTCPVDELRAELDRIVEGHPKWDGRAKVLQVIDATERTMQVRALVTASDSPTAWELRCDVRERLLSFLQREHPYALPREREIEFREESAGRDAGTKPGQPRQLDDPTFDEAPGQGEHDSDRAPDGAEPGEDRPRRGGAE